MIRYLKLFLSGLVVVINLMFLALGLCTIALQFPSVQTRAVSYATHTISEKLGYPVTIKRVNIKWFDVVSLDGISVKDTSQKAMIDVGRIDINLNVTQLIEQSDRDIHLDEVNVYQPHVRLVIVPEAGMLNIDGFIEKIAELTAPKVPRPPDAPDDNIPFTIGKSRVIDGTLSYDDPRENKRYGNRVFDYFHFTLKGIHGDLKDFLVQGDTIAFSAKKLQLVDAQTGLKVNRLDTKFLFCQKKMELNELDASIGDSHITDAITFLYNRSGDLSDFNHKVYIQGHLNNSRISSTDLGLFSTYVDDLHEKWMVTGDFNGKVDDFVLSNSNINFGTKSTLKGDLGFKGLPNLNAVEMDLRLVKSEILPEDIVQYYPELKAHETLRKFGMSTISGTYMGGLVDFAIDAQVKSEMGQLACDLAFHISDNQSTTYIGKVQTKNFELGNFLEDPENYQQLDFDGSVNGKGLELKYASSNMDAVVKRIGFRNYDYRNIKLRGHIQKQYFNGEVSANDTNFVVNLDGEFDLSQEKNYFDVQGSVKRANLLELGFLKDSITFSTDLNVQLSGNDVDELTGRANFNNTFLVHAGNKRNLVIDTLEFVSEVSSTERKISLNSEFFRAEVHGRFLPTVALKDLIQVMEEYKLYFFDNEINRTDYYSKKIRTLLPERYRIDYGLKTKDLSNLFAFLKPEIFVSPGTNATGTFRIDNTAFLSMNITTDSLVYGKNQFTNSEIDITTSKFVNNAEVLASALITSDKQQISAMVPTQGMLVEGTWDVDHIDFNGALKQVNSTNNANMAGEIRFLPTGFEISFKDSKLNLLEEKWTVPTNGLITITGTEVNFRNIGLLSGKQFFGINGLISEDPSRTLNFEIRNFNLQSVNPVFDTKLSGIIDGSVKMRDVYNSLVLDTKSKIENLGYGKYEFGNFTSAGEWDQVSGELMVNAVLNKNLKRVFDLTGSYKPNSTRSKLNLIADFTGFDIKALEPFSGGLISDVSGQAVGKVTINGNLSSPVLEGTLAVQKGKMKFDYLQSVFTFSDKVHFSEGEVTVKNMILTDPDGNTATVRGGVYYDRNNTVSLGFNADLKNFKILNTTAGQNSIFYGTAYVTGPVSVYGGIDNLNIEANATSNKGTKIYIPLDGATEVVTQDYIQFVSEQVAQQERSEPNEELVKTASGIKMDFNFNLTSDATCEIIFDRQTGDIITGVGKGRINMNIDTQGDFTMAGTYEIEKGTYNFTLQNIINKRFSIKPGSRIVWSGDPYGAQLDLKAVYTQSVSLLGVLPSQSTSGSSSDALTRRYPVEVTIGLSDKLLSPQIKYDLKILENPTLSSNNYQGYLEAFQNKLKTNEQELSRQVTSLLILNQLQPENSLIGQSTGQSFLGNSISELLSNQISRWASEINENLEVGVTGLSLDQNALNNIQLRFSYRFLNDRFRVTRDGRLNNGTVGGVAQYDAASLLGEWTLEYWLNPAGTVRVKAYNRNIQNLQNSFYLNNTVTTGGVSMQFTHSFNRFIPLQRPKLVIPFIPSDSLQRDSTDRLISTKN